MLQTTNYNLNKIELTDSPPDITVINPNWDSIDAEMKSLRELNNSLVVDYIRSPGYGVTTGSANIYALTLNPALAAYTAGVCVAVKINVANTGASTININGLGAKPIKDSKGNALASGKLALNSVYTFRYDGTNFILQGEGGEYGTATASDVLLGKTIGTDSGLIEGTIPSKSAATFTPSTVNQTIAANQYLSGVQTILGDADLLSANIKSGVNIFNVVGKTEVVDTYTTQGAVESQILSGQVAWSNGAKRTGIMTNNAVNQPVLNIQDQYYSIPEGYHSAGGKVTTHFNNLSAENVKNGVVIGGVVGNVKPVENYWLFGIPPTVDFNATSLTTPTSNSIRIGPAFLQNYSSYGWAYYSRKGLMFFMSISTTARSNYIYFENALAVGTYVTKAVIKARIHWKEFSASTLGGSIRPYYCTTTPNVVNSTSSGVVLGTTRLFSTIPKVYSPTNDMSQNPIFSYVANDLFTFEMPINAVVNQGGVGLDFSQCTGGGNNAWGMYVDVCEVYFE